VLEHNHSRSSDFAACIHAGDFVWLRTRHVPLSGSKRAKKCGATVIGKVDPKETFSVTIGLSGPKLPDADEYVGETLDPATFAETYGAKQEDADKVAQSLKKFGLNVESISLETRSMVVSGTAAAMEAAFKPGLAMMRSGDQGEYRGRQGALQIPAELKGIVTGVFGLDERQMARRKSRLAAARAAGPTLPPLTPSDFEQRYRFPSGNGSGQSIAIAEFGGVLCDIFSVYFRNSRRRRHQE
jgi:kumamolisin